MSVSMVKNTAINDSSEAIWSKMGLASSEAEERTVVRQLQRNRQGGKGKGNTAGMTTIRTRIKLDTEVAYSTLQFHKKNRPPRDKQRLT